MYKYVIEKCYGAGATKFFFVIVQRVKYASADVADIESVDLMNAWKVQLTSPIPSSSVKHQ